MFSGIVESVGQIFACERKDAACAFTIDTGFSDLVLGESVAVNGTCLTVSKLGLEGRAEFFASPETISRTNLGALSAKNLVNLERAVTPSVRLSGHMVQGHVDGKALLTGIDRTGESHCLEVIVPNALARYCVEKGSVALDGISLTINGICCAEASKTVLKITIIPHTWENTNLRMAATGDELNVEVDVIAKYVERLCQPY